MGAEKLSMLYQLHSRAQEEMKRAGGAKAFCSLHSDRIRFIEGGAGKIVLRAEHRPFNTPQPSSQEHRDSGIGGASRAGFSVQSSSVTQSNGAELAGATFASTLAEDVADRQVNDAQPKLHQDSDSATRYTFAQMFGVGAASGPVAAQTNASPPDIAPAPPPCPRAAHADVVAESGHEVDLAGKLTRILPTAAFMESSPGISDVYVPIVLLKASSPPPMIGDILLVRAVEH
eukprot:857250-Rhodomonas_salina.1